MYSTKQLSGWRCVLVALYLASGTAHAAEWKPDRPIEMIVPTGPGSGVDNTVRTLQASRRAVLLALFYAVLCLLPLVLSQTRSSGGGVRI